MKRNGNLILLTACFFVALAPVKKHSGKKIPHRYYYLKRIRITLR